MDIRTGSISETVTRDLEALKLQLAAMEAPDISAKQSAALAAEISAIRLHLKRLDADRQALAKDPTPTE